MLILGLPVIRAQVGPWHSNSLSLTHFQVKEELNYGLVFTGPGLVYSHSRSWESETRKLDYAAEFGGQYLESRGIAAINLHFVPVKMKYLFKELFHPDLALGPAFTAEYNYSMYPDLQSGFAFWMTHLSLGAAAEYRQSLAEHQFNLKLSTSLLGISSRPPVYREPYFFDLNFGYAMDYLHRDFKPGSWTRYNVSELELEWKPRTASRLSYAYVFQYTGYYAGPRLAMIHQSVKLIIHPQKKRP